MIGLQNKDRSFFTVKLLNTEIGEQVYHKDIVSLTVTEEMDRMTHGSIRLHDPNHLYSRILRNGILMEITWGYKTWDLDLANAKGLDVFSKLIERRGLKVICMNPSGSAGGDGAVYYNCNFLATDIRGLQDHIVYTSGTKRSMIQRVLERLGITTFDIVFNRMNDPLTQDTGERQWETDFQFLCRKAREWRTLFRIGRDPEGEPLALFIDPQYLEGSLVAKQMVGGKLELHYNSPGRSNVVE